MEKNIRETLLVNKLSAQPKYTSRIYFLQVYLELMEEYGGL